MNAQGPVSLFFLTALVGVAHGQIAFHPAVNLPVGDAPEGGALVDFDDTGKLGLVVASENPDKLEFFANKGNGTFDAAFAVLTGNDTSPEGVAPGDFDDDGDPDLLVALFSANQVRLVLRNASGAYVLGGAFPVGVEPSIVVAADFDRDGFLDGAVNDRVSGDVSVLINDGAGGFASAVAHAVGDETRCVAAGDITGDTFPDLAVSARDSRRVRLFANQGDGTFQLLRDLSLGSILEPEGVALADFDSDGKLDVVTATSGNAQQEHPSVFVQENGGNPWIGPINGQILPGRSPMGIVAADFDLDGHVDVATANADSNDVAFCKNGGIGIFMLPTFRTVGLNPEALVMLGGDLDDNGSTDLVTFNRDSNDVSVLINEASAPRGPSHVLRHAPPRR